MKTTWFKVVHDPGADKLEKKILGPVFLWCCRKDTGGVRTSFLGSDQELLPTYDPTVPAYRKQGRWSIRFPAYPSNFAGGISPPVAGPGRQRPAGLTLAPAGIASTQNVSGKSASGETCSPRPRPSTVPPTRNKGTSEPVSAAISRFSARGKSNAELPFQANQRCDRVGRACSQAALHRQPLLNMDGHIRGNAQPLQRSLHDLPAGIACIAGHLIVVAGNRDRRRRAALQSPCCHVYKVMDGQGLIDRRQPMVSVRPRRPTASPRLIFACERTRVDMLN